MSNPRKTTHTMHLAVAVALLAVAACSPKSERRSEPAAVAAADAAIAKAAEPERKCSDDPRVREERGLPPCIGMDAPQAAASHAYRITLDNGESFEACDITKPFIGKIGGGMVTMSFSPTDEHGGSVAWHFAGGGGVADTAYDYVLVGPEEKRTGSFHAKAAICGKAAGLAACAAAKKQDFSSTWTRIPACKQ